MPTYQYACTEPGCGHAFEQFQAFTDPALTQCPVCNHRLRKVYGSVGVVFKGSGFYRTDSRGAGADDGTGDKKAAESAPAASTSSDSGGKSDAAQTPSSTKTTPAAAAAPGGGSSGGASAPAAKASAAS
jgi:putative FmdB family regulatory protein